jgi:uncharacterized protein
VTRTFPCRTLVPGRGRGEALTLREPLSFWGGFDPATGTLIDTHHQQLGIRLSSLVVLMPRGRGSSSSSSVLAEAIRLGTAPAAIVLAEPDPVIALGAIVADELYGLSLPIVVAPAEAHRQIPDGVTITVDARPDEARLDAERG